MCNNKNKGYEITMKEENKKYLTIKTFVSCYYCCQQSFCIKFYHFMVDISQYQTNCLLICPSLCVCIKSTNRVTQNAIQKMHCILLALNLYKIFAMFSLKFNRENFTFSYDSHFINKECAQKKIIWTYTFRYRNKTK